MKDIFSVILGAGKGSRMKTNNNDVNKVLYPILGKPIIKYVIDAVKVLEPKEVVVVAGHGYENTAKTLEKHAKIVKQEQILGTGDALMQAKELLEGREGITIVLYGDTPLITPETIIETVKKHERENAKLTLLTSILQNAIGYNKIIREEKSDRVLKIKDTKEESSDEYSLTEIDGGVYVFDNELLFKYLPLLKPDNDHGELSIISLVEMFVNDGHLVEAYITSDRQQIFSINNRFHLGYAAKIVRKRVNMNLMLNGVSLEDPDVTYISPDVKIGADTIVGPNTFILGECNIGENNYIGPNTFIENCNIGNNNTILSSHLVDTTIKDNNEVGPFARMRNHTIIEGNSRVGNFVELKNAHYEKGVKSAHLTYIGDAHVGEATNIGCGTVTANYDGYNKMHTEIGDHSFIGSGTILVAPVEVESHAFTAAGSTITKNVKEGEMAFERSEQKNVEGLATKFLAKAKAKKEANKK